MKLIIAIVQDDDANQLSTTLRDKGFMLTKLASTGGFLSSGNSTFLIGVKKEQVEEAIDIIKEVCKTKKKITTLIPPSSFVSSGGFVPNTVELTVGGAVVFVTDIDKFVKI